MQATELLSAPIVLGVAKGGQKKAFYGRPNVLRKLGEVFPEAEHTPLVGIVLADSWDMAEFQHEHWPALVLHHQRGHRFLFLLAGSETSFSPIALGAAVKGEPVHGQ